MGDQTEASICPPEGGTNGAKLDAAIEPHLGPDETLRFSAAADASDTSGFMWVVVTGILSIAGLATLQSFGVVIPGAIVWLFMAAMVAAAVTAFLNVQRPSVIALTDRRVLIVVPRKGRDLTTTTVAFDLPIDRSLNIGLISRNNAALWGRRIWRAAQIENDREVFLGGLRDDKAFAAVRDMIAHLKERREAMPALSSAGVTQSWEVAARGSTNYTNLARLALVPVGILSATALARDGFDLRLSNYFAQLLDAYDNTVQTIARLIFEPMIYSLLSALRQWLQVDLVLLPHWKYVFILWWLAFAAIARVASQTEGHRTAIGLYAWGGICAFTGGLVAGMFPLASLGALTCMSALFVFLVGLHIFKVWQQRQGLKRLANGVASLMLATLALSSIGTGFYDPRGGTFGLQSTATTIALCALLGLTISLARIRKEVSTSGANFWHRVSLDPIVTGCLDILSVLGGAAAIVFVGNLMS